MAFGQERSISGTVTDENNEVIPGVNVIIKGTTTGTITDLNGNYNLAIPLEAEVLLFSYVGMQTQEIEIGEQVTIDIELLEGVGLDEVVVIGYGTVKRSDLTGSVSSVSSEELAKIPAPNLVQSLNGRAAGVQVNMASGGPGSEPIIRIRGNNSINADNSPLWVVDGFSNALGITTINPEDIESIEILKDASATAIYGSRGSNGVIIVTTKKGSARKGQINYKGYVGLQQDMNPFELMNNQEQLDYWRSYDRTFGLDALPSRFWTLNPEAIDTLQNTNWRDEYLRDNALMQSHYLSANGGNEKTTYNISFEYFDQEGIIDYASDYERFNFRANTDHKINERLTLGTNLNFRRVNRTMGASGSTYNSAMQNSPLGTPFTEDGEYNYFWDPFNPDVAKANPIQNLREIEDFSHQNTLNMQGFLSLKLFEGLVFNSEFSNSWNNRWENGYTPSTIFGADRTPANTGHYENVNLEWINRINYVKTFNDMHNLNTMLGSTIESTTWRSVNAGNTYFSSDQFKWNNLDQGQPIELSDKTVGSGFGSNRLASFIGRINYNYQNKYYVTFSGRYDGTSAFGAGNRWEFYPSGALAWRLSQEEFIQNLDLFDRLKLRVSYGVVGNSRIPSYTFMPLMSTVYADDGLLRFGDQNVIGWTPESYPNYNITWESTSTIDVGLDMGFLGDRIRGTVEYYHKRTNNLLYTRPLPPETGYGTMWDNIGSLENKGIELNIAADIIRTSRVGWDTDLNFTRNVNKVLDLGGVERINVTNKQYEETIYLEVGQPTGVIYAYQWEGIWQTQEEIDNNPSRDSDTPGMPRIRNTNQDSIISSDDKVLLGNPHPDFIVGWNNNFSFGNFSVSMFFQGMFGHDLLNYTKQSLYDRLKYRTDYWRPIDENQPELGGTTNEQPLAGLEGIDLSDHFIEKGSFFRLKNITVSYAIPQRFSRQVNMEVLQIYFSANDLLTFTNYTGMNPEANRHGGNPLLMGIDYNTYPLVKTFTIGVNATF